MKPAESAPTPVPLLIGLHTWSGDYQQTASAPYAEWCIAHDWAFLHPNFRGPNWTPHACGSERAVQDVLDAANHVRDGFNIDADRVYLIGTSGGGHMALLLAGRHPDQWAGVSAWVPIADLNAWFYECQTHGRNYATHLLQALRGSPHGSRAVRQTYRERSPLTWLHRARQIPIDINAGIRDGHNGSVPISHSLNAFNQLADPKHRLSDAQIVAFSGTAQVPAELVPPAPIHDPVYGERQPLFRRHSGNVRLTIFDGAHEGIPQAGLQWLAEQRRSSTSP